VVRPEAFKATDTFRLIPTKYSDGMSVLETLNLPGDVISELSELDAATNERVSAERGGCAWITRAELVAGCPEASIINAAFCHPGPFGSRFNDARRGAWYAGLEFETSLEEVAYHKRRLLRDARFDGTGEFDYQEFNADFNGVFHRLKKSGRACLAPEPVPECYRAGQQLAVELLNEGSAGIIYPSVRKRKGTCIVCFRPALVYNVRRGSEYRISIATHTDKVAIQQIAMRTTFRST
jgi:hypothetical protein